MDNPCYKCPKRVFKCVLNCEKWQEYVKWRNEEYEKRLAERRSNYGIIENSYRLAKIADRKKRK